MLQSLSFQEKGKENLVCKLQKALCELHQKGWACFFWFAQGFNKLDWSNCVYTLNDAIVLLLYVDDFVLFGKSKRLIENVISILSKHFDLKVLGWTKELLGVEFEGENGCISIHQSLYINEVYNRFKKKKFNFPLSSLPISKNTISSRVQYTQLAKEIDDTCPSFIQKVFCLEQRALLVVELKDPCSMCAGLLYSAGVSLWKMFV